jgi:hypothetical protein
MTAYNGVIARHEGASYTADIFIAGSVADALRVCRQQCFDVGLCVTVAAVEYVYTGGAELGVRVGLVNYPRFPSEPTAIFDKAIALAELLIVELSQGSALVQATDRTVWLTRRPGEESVVSR